MNQLESEVSIEALRQSQIALRSLPSDATVSVRCNAVTTAVRALAAYRAAHLPAGNAGLPSSGSDDER